MRISPQIKDRPNVGQRVEGGGLMEGGEKPKNSLTGVLMHVKGNAVEGGGGGVAPLHHPQQH